MAPTKPQTEPAAAQAHLALARKWRPRKFAQVVGQQQALAVLTGSLSSGRVHHALLFTGIRGVGKTTLARIFAKALNCAEPAGAEPCGACAACRQLDAGSHPDLIEIDAASTTQVDSMRELLDSARYAPAQGKYKVYIIDEVHMLSRHAFNAMLKTLEEPPAHVKFVLATTDPQQVPATIQSRCMRLALRRLPAAQIAEHLGEIARAEKLDCEPAALELIADAADGSVRDALSILDEAISGGALTEQRARALIGWADRASLARLLDCVLSGDTQPALECAARLHRDGVAPDGALSGLISLVHRRQLADLDPQAAGKPADPVRLQVVYEIAAQARERLAAGAADAQIVLDMAVLRMLALFTETAAAGKRAPALPPARPIAAPPRTAAKPAKPPAQPAAARLPTDNEQWLKLCESLAASAPAKALANYCIFKTAQGDALHLELAADHKAQLLQKENLAGWLTARCGRTVELVIDLADQVQQRTPKQDATARERDTSEQERLQFQDTAVFAKVKKHAPASEVVGIRPGDKKRA